MRLRNDPKAREYLENSQYLIENFPIILDENIILEIGMGKGEMLCEMAKLNPHKKFIGIEKFPTVAAKAAKKFNENNLKNIFIINKDLDSLFDQFQGTVNEIWLTFSDPWPKKRHYKRRLTYRKYLNLYKNLLSSNGILKIKTDNDLFFNRSLEEIDNFKSAKIIYQTTDLHNSDKNNTNIPTGYEIKWSSKGKKTLIIWKLYLQMKIN